MRVQKCFLSGLQREAYHNRRFKQNRPHLALAQPSEIGLKEQSPPKRERTPKGPQQIRRGEIREEAVCLAAALRSGRGGSKTEALLRLRLQEGACETTFSPTVGPAQAQNLRPFHKISTYKIQAA